ncbi:protein of unknown function [Neorhodopirellula lusitana]|uniref:Protein-glutamine gamma-glutamyltransferase-like C-terminal domain-containing protein n=1 Tax=Neorhodopirellula lusitana TaxID=445327 RepID=A0ABY1Q8V3_9BACT|nr:DUF4129 domain-containing protein [Neorhodopirellula lusitana]SMP63416.1 protein of unknown function [Neorhodopirellula lusitana]
MQLDKTNVAIRVRTLSEIGDLSLLMIRRYPRAFFQAFFLGAGFWIVLDLILLGWLPFRVDDASTFDDEASSDFFRYLFWMATLVFLQAPIAGVLSTFSLGQSIFEGQPTLSRTFREVRSMAWPLVWTLGVKRMAIPAALMLAFRWGQEWSGFFDVFMPMLFILIAAMIRGNRPFVAEMILLERCPLRTDQPGAITLKRRSKALHSPMAGELGGRFLAVSMILVALMGCVFYSIFWVRGIAIGVWEMNLVACLVFYPLALWLIASLSVVVRLLGYLDARIRLEGWEVELAIRAEAIRQFGDDIMDPPQPPPQQELPPTSQQAPAPATDLPTAAALGKTGSSVVAITLAAWLSFAGNAFADETAATPAVTPATPTVTDSVWFDSDAGTLMPIELVDERTDTMNRDSRWTPKPPSTPKAAAAPPVTTGAGTSWGSLSIGNLFGWLLLGLLMAVLIGALVYVFANSSFDFRSETDQQTLVNHHRLDEQTKQRIAELPAELRDTDVNPRTELERLMQRGDFDRAIIFLFGHQLLLLDRASWLRLSRWKTNRQYVRETQSSQPAAGQLLGKTVDSFEQSYFGRHSLTREQFDVLWNDNLKLEAMVASPTEAPR